MWTDFGVMMGIFRFGAKFMSRLSSNNKQILLYGS